jgi:F0F1-type ATP synthase membrane subunit c/vacuolar-type H+-ATPase subunit K
VAVAYLCLGEGLAFGAAVEVVARRRPRTSTLPGLIQAVAEAGRLLDG